MLRFDNRFLRELPGDPETRNETRQVHGACWSRVAPTPVRAPRLLAHSREMAAILGLDPATLAGTDWVEALAGNRLLPGMETYATCYGGHQFGHWAGQLGDGRAIYLGEALDDQGGRWELQLKGAGPTPYSRRADGRAVLRSSIREFLCSEAMHHLGVPTTRALSLVQTGDPVLRDMFYDGHPRLEPGAIVCRVAPSFIRFGHFELPSSRSDRALLQRLVDFTLDRDFPHLAPGADRLERWYVEVCERTARLLARWMQVGFVHGVMNTDNMSILGLTIDYGPYGWVDDFDPGWTPNTTDASGKRYCFGRQPDVARWNLERLADALDLLVPRRTLLAAGIERYDQVYNEETGRLFAGKFGFAAWQERDADLVSQVLELMARASLDMTDFFRRLAAQGEQGTDLDDLAGSAYDAAAWQEYRPAFAAWREAYRQRLAGEALPDHERRARMERHNPRYVLRNYLAQQAINRAEAGDPGLIEELLEVLRQPYREQPGREAFAALRPEWARHKAGCSMLSCSS